jgi:hypothetical protein
MLGPTIIFLNRSITINSWRACGCYSPAGSVGGGSGVPVAEEGGLAEHGVIRADHLFLPVFFAS